MSTDVSTGSPNPIGPTVAILFANEVLHDYLAQQDFFKMWIDGDWCGIRECFPEFEQWSKDNA